ncbi:MAG: gluconokinase [Rhizobacter sp.]|nr:gluconokinase [Rhizobacter sp.]
MGVAGCGKTSTAQAVAERLGWPLIEGDDYHAESSKAKMKEGIALTDADRAGWLATLGGLLATHQREGTSVLLTCSALKRSYRDLLRARSPGLRFVFLDIDKASAIERVAARGTLHLFPTSLVDSQFATLEPPHGEPGVLCISALLPREALATQVADWLRSAP